MPRIFDATPSPLSPVQWSWVTLSGPDAQDFLHRLTTVHVQALALGQGSPGFFLNAQGKVRAYFTLWNFGIQSFSFEFDAGADGRWKTELLAAIDQYTFAEKIQVGDVTGLECRWILAEGTDIAGTLAALGAPGLKAGETVAIDEEIRLAHHGDRDFGLGWITAWGRGARLAQWIERALSPESLRPITLPELEALRIAAVRPWVDKEITSSTIPLEAGITDGIATAKGCYPGQEVIERIVSLGSPARRLAKIEGRGPAPRLGESILNLAEPAVEVGTVTSVAASGEGFAALGYLRKIHAKEGLEVRFASESAARGKVAQVAPYA